jgi:hypothetical protein
MGSAHAGFMIDCRHNFRSAFCTVTMLLGLGVVLAGCANMSDTALSAFAEPAKYDSMDCKQLEATRKGLAVHAAEVQGLMAKAETGFAGPVVAEVAYRNDYVATRASSKLADEVWQRNNCVATPEKPGAPATPVPAPAKRGHHKGTANSEKLGGE